MYFETIVEFTLIGCCKYFLVNFIKVSNFDGRQLGYAILFSYVFTGVFYRHILVVKIINYSYRIKKTNWKSSYITSGKRISKSFLINNL